MRLDSLDRRIGRSWMVQVLVLALVIALLAPAEKASAKQACAPLTEKEIGALSASGEPLADGVVPLGPRSEERARTYSFQMPVQAAGLPPLGEFKSRDLIVQALGSGTVHVLTSWRETNAFPIDQTDIDLFIRGGGDGAGSMVYNPFPEPFRTASRGEGFGSGDGGPGWEYVELNVKRCTGYLIENVPWSSEEAHDIEVKVWMTR